MQSKCAEHISFCAEGVVVMGNLSLKPGYHVKGVARSSGSSVFYPEKDPLLLMPKQS